MDCSTYLKTNMKINENLLQKIISTTDLKFEENWMGRNPFSKESDNEDNVQSEDAVTCHDNNNSSFNSSSGKDFSVDDKDILMGGLHSTPIITKEQKLDNFSRFVDKKFYKNLKCIKKKIIKPKKDKQSKQTNNRINKYIAPCPSLNIIHEQQLKRKFFKEKFITMEVA